jgi:RHS repeat-associated protein
MATFPVVISDTEAVYLYGLDIIAQQQDDRLYYVHDGLGTVRQLLDTTGQIETNYAYDPFGVPVVAGDASNPYQFTGEAWDAEVGLLYLRARYYQPEVGRFITKDPWIGEDQRPGTLNRYVYVTNNPVNLVDPAGLNGEGIPGIPRVATYIRWRMQQEAQGLTLRTIWLLNLESRSMPGVQSTQAKLGAFVVFGWMVHQDGPWDPKPYIRDHGEPHYSHQIGDYWYYYDIWGNIMFGYLGTAAGFSESELLEGAGLEQIGSDAVTCVRDFVRRQPCTLPCRESGVTGLKAWDHRPDRVTAKIGIRLWKQRDINVQTHHIIDAIVDAGDKYEIPRQREPWGGEKGPMRWWGGP